MPVFEGGVGIEREGRGEHRWRRGSLDCRTVLGWEGEGDRGCTWCVWSGVARCSCRCSPPWYCSLLMPDAAVALLSRSLSCEKRPGMGLSLCWGCWDVRDGPTATHQDGRSTVTNPCVLHLQRRNI